MVTFKTTYELDSNTKLQMSKVNEVPIFTKHIERQKLQPAYECFEMKFKTSFLRDCTKPIFMQVFKFPHITYLSNISQSTSHKYGLRYHGYHAVRQNCIKRHQKLLFFAP